MRISHCENDVDVPLPRIFIYLFDEVLFSQKRVHLIFFHLLPSLGVVTYTSFDIVIFVVQKKKYKLLLR